MAKGKAVEVVLSLKEFNEIMAKNDTPIGVVADIKDVLDPEVD
jgi:hypothetical protein